MDDNVFYSAKLRWLQSLGLFVPRHPKLIPREVVVLTGVR